MEIRVQAGTIENRIIRIIVVNVLIIIAQVTQSKFMVPEIQITFQVPRMSYHKRWIGIMRIEKPNHRLNIRYKSPQYAKKQKNNVKVRCLSHGNNKN